MPKLNQIIAVEKGIKSKTHSFISEIHKTIQKNELFNGFTRTYQKKDEEGEDLPSESKRVQITAQEAIRQANYAWSEIIDITARKDWTNTKATASVTIDGNTIIENAPVSFLLFLEKTLTDIRTFVNTLPILDESEEWNFDEKSGFYRTTLVQTSRTKKTVKPIVLYDATDKHPAQTQLIQEDIIAGYWNHIKQSGGIPKTERIALINKIDTVSKAVKQAREEANTVEESAPQHVAENIFNYVFGS